MSAAGPPPTLPPDLRSPTTALPPREAPPPSPPRLRHGWLIAMVVVAVWWPLDTYWQSDDWIAVHYAADPARAASDLAGPQYGIESMVRFWRPLITLSFAAEQLAYGADPFVSHLTNAVGLALSAWLLALLVARFFGRAAGVWAGLLWGTMPLHAGSVLWAVGRVDSLTVPWILLSAWLTVRAIDGARWARLGAALAFAAALASKELALVTPGLAGLLALAAAERGRRLRAAVAALWPLVVVLGAYLVWRQLLLGEVLGGYEGGVPDPVSGLGGLAGWTARVLNPALDLRDAALWPEGSWRLLGFLPAAAAVLLLLRHRGAGVAALGTVAGLYVVAVLPTFQFWADAGAPMNARYFTLPSAALAALVASGRAWTVLPALVVAVLPWLEVREDWRQAHLEAKTIHGLMLREAPRLQPGPLFVAELPRRTETGIVTFHLGVDRLLAPPFGPGRQRTYALRPLSPRGDAPRLDLGFEGLPFAQTAALVDTTGFGLLPPRRSRPLEAHLEGSSHLTEERLWAVHEGRIDPAFVMGGPRAEHYRVTVFTASGYVTAVLPNELPAGAEGGRVSLRAWLAAPTTPRSGVVLDLRVPVLLDLEPTFPVWIEAGRVSAPRPELAPRFVAGAAARDAVWLRFDRGYAELMRPGR